MKNYKNTDTTMDEIVFLNKNKAYGAYDLRKSYLQTFNKAFIFGTSAFILTMFIPTLMAKMKGMQAEEKYVLANVSHFLPPPVENLVTPPPPPPPAELPKASTTEFLPPVIEPDQLIDDNTLPPTQSALDLAPAGAETIKGDPNAIADVIIEEKPAKTDDIVEIAPTEDPVFTRVEQDAQFPGGNKKLGAYLSSKLRYPDPAQRANVSGKVFLSFVVDKVGKISDVSVTKGIGFGCDEEAERVVKSMPNWIPGRQSGTAVKSTFQLTILFHLDE